MVVFVMAGLKPLMMVNVDHIPPAGEFAQMDGHSQQHLLRMLRYLRLDC